MKNNKTKLLKKYRINQEELLDLECRHEKTDPVRNR